MIAAGLRELVYAPKAYMWHAGPLAGSSASLNDILSACEDMPAIDGAPPGWACFGQHVDDSAGVASSQSVIQYIMGAIQVTYSCKMTRWDKVLGYTVTVHDYEDFSTATLSCKPIIEAAINRHIRSKGEPVLTHKNPYPSDLKTRLSKGITPDPNSPEYKPYIAMQLECRSLLGLLIWVSEAYPQIKYVVNFACAYMAEPSLSVYIVAKIALQHIYWQPLSVTWGGPGCKSLEAVETLPLPFTVDGYVNYGLMAFSDSNVDTPSISGTLIMLAGGAILMLSQRQHLISPDSHTSEVAAAGTCVDHITTIRHILQEMHCPQLFPTQIYLDSLSTFYVAADKQSVRRSQHNMRRIAVLNQARENGEITPIHVPEKHMAADGLTKPIPRTPRLLHLTMTHNCTPAAASGS